MTRKRVLLGTIALFAVVVPGLVLAGSSMAQRHQSFAHILVQNPGDADVAAVIQGKDLTRGEVREAADLKQTVDPSLTRDEAVKAVIVFVVDNYIIEAEVESRGLVPTDDEARAFMRPHQQACAGQHGQECRDAIEQMGQTVDEYWADALPDYRDDLGSINLFNAVFDEQGIADDASNATLVSARDAYKTALRDQAEITWYDEELRLLYEDAKASH